MVLYYCVVSNRSLLAAIAAAGLLVAESAFAMHTEVVTPAEFLALFVKKGIPQYPFEARRARTEGTGLFRMYVEPNGAVTSVGVMKSTGSKILDLAAAGGLYQWRAKPGRRRQIDIPMTFRLWH
jgi:TonB family protein